eukprot:scaffold2726_cov167-Amphora_coffeaeformis.AAC.13
MDIVLGAHQEDGRHGAKCTESNLVLVHVVHPVLLIVADDERIHRLLLRSTMTAIMTVGARSPRFVLARPYPRNVPIHAIVPPWLAW